MIIAVGFGEVALIDKFVQAAAADKACRTIKPNLRQTCAPKLKRVDTSAPEVASSTPLLFENIARVIGVVTPARHHPIRTVPVRIVIVYNFRCWQSPFG